MDSEYKATLRIAVYLGIWICLLDMLNTNILIGIERTAIIKCVKIKFIRQYYIESYLKMKNLQYPD